MLVLFISTLAGVYFATQIHLAYPPSMRRPWSKSLSINLIHYWIWGALVPVVVFLGRRYRFHDRWWRALPVHVAASVAVTLVQLTLAGLLLGLVFHHPLSEELPDVIRFNFHSSLPTYWLILFVYYALDYSAHAAHLKASLTQARLDALRTQLNPHFLFNTLNSISSLMYSDTEAADRMMTRLSDLLRSTLRSDGAQEVTLREELDFVDRYLEIERIRFEERLRIAMRVEPEALDALRYAVGPRESGGAVEIAARRVDARLLVQVSDDGAGPQELPVREGVGLSNIRARLEQLYGGAAVLRTGRAEGGGFFAQLDLPYRPPGATSS